MPAPPPNPESARAPSPRRPAALLWPFGALATCLMLGVIGFAAAGGYWAGLDERTARQTQAAAQSLADQYRLALDDLAAGRYELARQRLEFVLGLDPLYPGAAEKLALARQGAPSTPAGEPPASTTPVASRDSAAELFAEAQARLDERDWDGLIGTLTVLRNLYPDYEAVRVDGMLFLALRNRGLARINGDQLEEGLFDLSRAEAIGPLDAEALAQRDWAELYQTANSFWNVNWEKAAYYFADLYAAAPYFKDTNLRYFQATRNHADQLYTAGDFCRARDQYAIALQLEDDPELQARHDLAVVNCINTPTPDPLATSDPSATPDLDGATPVEVMPSATPAP